MTEAFNTVTTQWRAGNYDASVVDGESAASLLTRVEVFLQELKTRPENRILIATHGRTLRAITCLLHGLPISEMERFNHRNTSLVEAAYNRENNTYQVLRENDTMHLGTLKLTV